MDIPKGWPKTTYDFKTNPLTQEKFDLGKELFYDPILSSDKMVSCASCHFQGNVFSHKDHSVSHGVGDVLGERNSISLQNLAWSENFMWDGRIRDLVSQPKSAITNPIEMNETMENVVKKLKEDANYVQVFNKAFPFEGITSNTISVALSQFMIMITSTNSKYDKVKKGVEVFTKEESEGYQIFKNNCASCHKEPLFSSAEFKSNGLKLDTDFKDYGRMNITKNKKDSLLFKVPSLRNIEYSMDYMHDGRFEKLEDVLNHYNSLSKNDYKSKELKVPFSFSDQDLVKLKLFLFTLTDPTYLRNKSFSFQRHKI
jgi:cytochrome c peroxidase